MTTEEMIALYEKRLKLLEEMERVLAESQNILTQYLDIKELMEKRQWDMH